MGGGCSVSTEMMLDDRLIVCNLELKIFFEDLDQSGRLFQTSAVMLENDQPKLPRRSIRTRL